MSVSESEVTVERGATTGMYRMAYKGQYEFFDDEPSVAEIAAFKKYVDNGKGLVREARYSGQGRGLTVRHDDGTSREGTVVQQYAGNGT